LHCQKKTGKVGWGEIQDNAYIDLLVGISTAYKYALDNKIDGDLGVPSDHEMWKHKNSLRMIHRMEITKQKELIECVESLIGEEYNITKNFFLSNQKVSINREELEKTHINLEAILATA